MDEETAPLSRQVRRATERRAEKALIHAGAVAPHATGLSRTLRRRLDRAALSARPRGATRVARRHTLWA